MRTAHSVRLPFRLSAPPPPPPSSGSPGGRCSRGRRPSAPVDRRGTIVGRCLLISGAAATTAPTDRPTDRSRPSTAASSPAAAASTSRPPVDNNSNQSSFAFCHRLCSGILLQRFVSERAHQPFHTYRDRHVYTGWPQKSKPLPNVQKIVLNRIRLSMRLDLFVKLKNESSTIILFVGIRYSMRDLLSDLNNYA